MFGEDSVDVRKRCVLRVLEHVVLLYSRDVCFVFLEKVVLLYS